MLVCNVRFWDKSNGYVGESMVVNIFLEGLLIYFCL